MSSLFKCGTQFWHPNWLQKFANTKTFITVYGVLGTAQAMATVYFLVTLTTLEKQFKIPSHMLGFILSGNELAQISLALVLSYVGGQKNRPKWIGWGVFCSALSCFILASPHFIYGAGVELLQLTEEFMENTFLDSPHNQTVAEIAKSQNQLCSAVHPMDDCDASFDRLPLVLIFLSQFVLGIGNTLYYSLGQSYLDDSTERVNTPKMLGYAMSLRLLGPGIAFVLGREALTIFVDPSKTPLINSKDPRWVGAWWLGWIVLGSTMLIIALLIGMFPQQLPRRLTVIEHMAQFIPEMVVGQPDLPAVVRHGFLASCKRLLTNKLLMYNMASGIFYLLGSLGYMTYLNKYFEVQFHKSKADATIISGPITLFGMMAGFLISGIVISKFKPSPRVLLLWNVTGGVIYLLGQFSYLFLTCPDAKMLITKGQLNVTTTCNVACNCHNAAYSPVCHGASGVTFFSPCHAGCNVFDQVKKVYSDCTCVDIDGVSGATLLPGACSTNCALGFYGFTLVSMVINFLDTSGKIGNFLVNYRCVATNDKSFAQGFILMAVSLFALIPGPILYGYVIDHTCLVWTEKCGERGNCQLYDQKRFRLHVNFVAMALTAIGIFFDLLVWRHGRNLVLYNEVDEPCVANKCRNTKPTDQLDTEL